MPSSFVARLSLSVVVLLALGACGSPNVPPPVPGPAGESPATEETVPPPAETTPGDPAPEDPVGAGAASPATVAYLNAAGNDRLNATLALSDGTLLIAGGADDLSWVPPGVPRVTLDARAIQDQPGGGRVGFIAHLSADLRTLLRVIVLPAGATEALRDLRTSSLPGQATGGLYVSGLTASGYFIAKLNANFVAGAPQRFDWVRNVKATGDHRSSPAWDVGSDGKVVYASGEPYGVNWAEVARLRADGTDDVVENWRFHWFRRADGTLGDGDFSPASSRTGVTVTKSAIVFKANRSCALRSWTAQDYRAVTPDGNGGTRQGRWPMDLFFSGPCTPGAVSTAGPGYTGYRLGAKPTQRIGSIAVDRRDNSMYVGFSVQSRLPDGNPDFEPGVIAMTSSGALKWWSRLYTETPKNSSPDQYVDGLAVDPATGSLVVLARSHGNNTFNLWSGKDTFHRTFTGTEGNIHVSWLGKLNLSDGGLRAASYVAEYVDSMRGTQANAPYADPNLDGWPSHNAGWPDLNTTRCRSDVKVDPTGRVYLLCTGRRTITTANAFQKMLKPNEGVSSWNDFVRVFTPDLRTLTYSSLLTGRWDRTTGVGGGNTTLLGVAPVAGGVVVVGLHAADASTGLARGNAVPTANVPAWGAAQPRSESGLVARLRF